MLLCLPLFLGFAAEAQAQAECVSNDLLAHVDARMQVASVDRWQRIENALMEQPNPIALFEVKEIYERRKANGWSLNRLDEIIEAMECLAAPPLPDPISESCVSPQLQADVKAYSEETWHGSSHVERWLRVLQTFSGTANDSTIMTPAEAQEMADRWSNGRWNPVVDALQCLEVEALNDQTEVQTEEPEDTPQPLQDEGTAMPQQADPIDTTSFRVYFHDGTQNPGSGEYRINEDDHWESELIIHYKSNQTFPTLNTKLCINHDIWSGDNHWNNGPITLPGFDTYSDRSNPLFGDIQGHWQCTASIDDSGTIAPNVTVLQNAADGREFVYRAKVRTRDNNVVEDDFSIADDLVFWYGDASANKSSGTSKFRPETEEVPDRAAWRLDQNALAWPSLASACLGDGNQWLVYQKSQLTCGFVSQSRWTDRGTHTGTNSCTQEIKRADVSAETWLPDHCYPTKDVVGTPPTSDGFLDNTDLPIIKEDDVSWIKLHKQNGKWIVSVYKPIMVTDGDDLWWKTKDGAMGTIDFQYPHTLPGIQVVRFLIPSVNGIVQDGDYALYDLKRVGSPPVLTDTYLDLGVAEDSCTVSREHNLPANIVSFSVVANGLGPQAGGIAIDPPPVGSDFCR